MDVDDEDPAWLEACLAAVDNLPAANLRSSAIETPIGTGLQPNGKAGDTGPNQDTAAVNIRRSPVLPVSRPGPPAGHAGIRNATGACSSLNARPIMPTAAAPATAGSSAGHLPYSGNSNSRARPPPLSSRSDEGRRRMRGVGANVRILYCVLFTYH